MQINFKKKIKAIINRKCSADILKKNPKKLFIHKSCISQLYCYNETDIIYIILYV